MKVRVTFKKAWLKWDTALRRYMPVIDSVHVNDLAYLKFAVNSREITWNNDPDNSAVALVNVPLVNVSDCAKLEIGAILQYPYASDFNNDFNNDFAINTGGDFNNDFNNDFAIGINIQQSLVYQNQFTIFGYDLGNSYVGLGPNPEFVIYFVSNNLADFNDDFNEDFKSNPYTYADYIAYRQPFTNNIYYYDATSFYENQTIKWWFVDPRYSTHCKDLDKSLLLEEGRNGVFCMDGTVELNVQKTQWSEVIVETEGNCCGNPKEYKKKLNEVFVHWNQGDIEAAPKWTSKYSNSYLIQECATACGNNEQRHPIHTPVEVRTYLDRDNIHIMYKDDIPVQPYKKDIVRYQVIHCTGSVLGTHEQHIELSEYNCKVDNWSYTPYAEGEYYMVTEIITVLHDGTILRKCTDKDKFVVGDVYSINLTDCALNIDHCGENELSIKLEKVIYEYGRKKLVTHDTINLTKSGTINLPDSVYQATITYEDSTKVYIFAVHCDLMECYKKNLVAFTIEDCKDIRNIARINSMMAIGEIYFNQVNKLLGMDTTKTDMDKIKAEFFDLSELYKNLMRKCDECNKLRDCGCGATT